MSGLLIGRGRSGVYLEIVRVHDGSPASEAGLLARDKVTKINGKAVTDYRSEDLRELLLQKGKAVTLDVLRDGKSLQMTITLRRLL